MLRKQRQIGHEDRLTLVEHLDELRTRIVIAVFAFVVAIGLCFWQNHLLLDIINDPLPKGTKPITLSPTEPFTTTLTVSAYAALLVSLPVILYQLYAFVLPAFSPSEKKVALPLLLMVPVLFVAGAVFAYFVIVPAALTFLLNFNEHQFNTQMLGLTRLGIVTPQKLKRNRRYAYLGCAVVAALLPGVDPVSMLIEMVPLVVLYELSILLSVVFGRSSGEAADRLASAEGS